MTWLKDNSFLLNPYLIQNGSVSSLVLRSVTKEQHSGVYHCEATNLAGRTPSEAGTLTVTSKVTEIPTAGSLPREGKDCFKCRFEKKNSYHKSEYNGIHYLKLRPSGSVELIYCSINKPKSNSLLVPRGDTEFCCPEER